MLTKIGKKLSLVTIIFVIVAMFTGCAVRNEGKVDFRRTDTSFSLIENTDGKLVKKAHIITKNQIKNLQNNYKPTYKFIDINLSKIQQKAYTQVDDIYKDLHISDKQIKKQVDYDLNSSQNQMKKYIKDYKEYFNKYDDNKSSYYIPNSVYNDLNFTLKITKKTKDSALKSETLIKFKNDNNDSNITAFLGLYKEEKNKIIGFSTEEENQDQKSIFLELSDTSFKELNNTKKYSKKLFTIVKDAMKTNLYDLQQEQNSTKRCNNSEKKLFAKEYFRSYKQKFFDTNKTIKDEKIRLDINTILFRQENNETINNSVDEYKGQLKDKYITEIKNNIKKYLDIRPLPFQNLKMKNFSLGRDKDTRFTVGDSLSLHLRSAYIKNFSELPSLMLARQFGKAIGEVAVVANAFEETSGKELSFEDMRAGRVVFYSDNVNKGQFLNFNNMPIYGPLKYKGAPFAFRIAIFELDTESKQATMMLNTIAQAGSTAYPPASPVLKVLNSFGDTLLNGDQTDTEFRYTMVLDPKSGSDKTNHFTLEVGNYVFVRMEDRTENIDWDRLVLDANDAKLYWKDRCRNETITLPYNVNNKLATINKSDIKNLHDSDINCSKSKSKKRQEYTDGTYIVVEIAKNISNIGVQLAQNNFGDLISTLENQDSKKAESFQNIKDSLTYAAIKRSQIYSFQEAKDILAELKKSDVNLLQKKLMQKHFLQ